MSGKTYNGWTNYETWCVKLWLDDDYGIYTHVREGAADTLEEFTERDTDEATEVRPSVDSEGFIRAFAEWLKNYLDEMQEEIFPDAGASVFTDLINAALSEVNWAEMAESYLEDARKAANV